MDSEMSENFDFVDPANSLIPESEMMTSPNQLSRALKMDYTFIESSPISPFSGFASNLPNICSTEKKRSHASLHAPSSPFGGFAQLLNNSPGRGSSPHKIMRSPESTSDSSFMTPEPRWSPKCRRNLLQEEDSLDRGPVSFSPETSQMLSFGEKDVLGDDHITVVGKYGSFKNCTNEKFESKPPSKKKSKTAPTKRSLVPNLENVNTNKSVGNKTSEAAFNGSKSDKEQEQSESKEKSTKQEECENSVSNPNPDNAAQPELPESESNNEMFTINAKSRSKHPPKDSSKLCKCKKSKCVRQYCVCFRAGVLCDGCDCVDCYNDGKHEKERLTAVEHIKTSDPLAFETKIKPDVESSNANTIHHVRGCKCKNSKCLKKYCECFEHGVACSSKCDCVDCLNNKPKDADGLPLKKKRIPGTVPLLPEVKPELPINLVGSPSTLEQVEYDEAKKEAFYRVADKYLASAPQTPQRADYQLLPLTPMDQPQANANLDFSQHLLGSNTISPAMPILGDQCQVLPRTPNGNSNSGYMRYSLSPSTAVILDLSSPVREPHKGEEKFETNVKEDRADEKKTEKEKKDAMVHLELIAVK